MKDIVRKLLNHIGPPTADLVMEAVDEIVRLREKVKTLSLELESERVLSKSLLEMADS